MHQKFDTDRFDAEILVSRFNGDGELWSSRDIRSWFHNASGKFIVAEQATGRLEPAAYPSPGARTPSFWTREQVIRFVVARLRDGLSVPGARGKRRLAKPPAPTNKPHTHCHRGHPLEGDNLYVYPDGRRRCKTCKRDRDRERERSKRR